MNIEKYNQIFQIAKEGEEKLDSNRKIINNLTSFEINELFFYIFNLQKTKGNQDKLRSIISKIDLKKSGFYFQIDNLIKNLLLKKPDFKEDSLINQLKLYAFKPDFYGDYETIFKEFLSLGISEENTAIIVSSIGELIDNAFFHNLGQWSNKFGPMVLYFAQHIPEKKELNISVCDFGVGFLETLKKNYPELKNENEAIKLALKAQTTGRSSKIGGNGLVYLQKNIFNGFEGEIMIRSKNVLVRIKKRELSEIIVDNLPFDFGTNVFISLKY